MNTGKEYTREQDPTLPEWVETVTGTGACRSCGASVLWARTVNGKNHPLNPDNTSHFANCPEAAKWRKR